MTTQQLIEKGGIYFEKITTGFSEYGSTSLKLKEKEAKNHFKELCKKYGKENSFADFYYFRLDEVARAAVESELTLAEIDYLKGIQPKNPQEEIIFELENMLLEIVVKLNASEMLFSTLYFVGEEGRGTKSTTWWGNYEQEYICFRQKL